MLVAAVAASPARADGEDDVSSPSCQVRVSTIPEGAAVECDGVVYDTAAAAITGLKPGKHLLIARKQGYNDTRMTIELSDGQRMAVEMKLEPILGLVIIHSIPSGATVEIDGANRGETPLLLTDLPIGQYRMRLIGAGYRPQEIDLSVASRKPKRLEISLDSSSATLVLESQPSGARILINGIDRATTPSTVAGIPEGEVTLQLELDGCEPYEQTIRMTAGERQEMTAVLKPIPAQLIVVSMPARARIYVNNQFRGESPVTLTELEPGSYRIRAEMDAHEIVARTVYLDRADKVTEEFRLQPNCGAIEIRTAPAGVKIFVDGKERGITKAPAGETDRVSEDLKLDLVPIGTRTLELTKKGFFSKEFTLEVERDKTTTVQQALKRRFIPNFEVRTSDAVYKGVLIEQDPQGNVRLEVRPGVIRTVKAKDIRSSRPLRDDGP